MKHLRIISISIITLSLLLSLNSCYKDKFDLDKLSKEIHYQPSLAAPIAYGSLNLIDGINKYDSIGRFRVNKDGFLSVYYFDHVETDSVQNNFQLDNQGISILHSNDIDFSNFTNQGDQLQETLTSVFSLNTFNSDAELDSIWIKSGRINLAVLSTFQHEMQIVVRFPSLIKNGVAFQQTINFQATGGTFASNNNLIDGYHLDLTQTAQNYNQIPIEVTINATNSGANTNGAISLNIEVQDIKHQAIFGYFGTNSLVYSSGKVNIELFDNDGDFQPIDFWFEDPKLKIQYDNSFGIPVNFYFDSLVAYSTANDENYNVVDNTGTLPLSPENPYHISCPTNMGTNIKDSLILHKDNSNIREVIHARPEWLRFIANAKTNPGQEANHNNFIDENSKFKADVEVELPLYGFIDRFLGADTSEFDFQKSFENVDFIKRLYVRANIENGLPIFIESQFYFVDSSYNILDSLIHDNNYKILESAEIDADGRVTSQTYNTIEVELTQEQIETIKPTKHMIFLSAASTQDATAHKKLKIYPEYKVDFDIALEADIDLTVNLDTIN